jgi:hypothetical protein
MDNTLVKIESPQIQTSLTQTGWDLPTAMTETDWKQAGSFLMQVNQARQWWLGDWWNACKWGDGKAACKEVGIEYDTAKMCGQVSRSFKLCRRIHNLTFSHHREVCPIEDQVMQDQLLDWCLSGKKRKSVRDLREKVQKYLEKKDWEDFDATVILEDNIQDSKALTESYKLVEELKAENTRLKEDNKTPAPATLNNLIPDVEELLENKRIMPAMARKISTMTDEGQQAWLTIFVSKNSVENQLREKTQKVKELESRPEPEPKIVEKEVIPLNISEKLKKAEKSLAKVKKAESDVKKAENDTKDIRANLDAVSNEKHQLEYEISKLKKQLEVDNPNNVDLARAKSIKETFDLIKNEIIHFQKDRATCGGGMRHSIAAFDDVISDLTSFRSTIEDITLIDI